MAHRAAVPSRSRAQPFVPHHALEKWLRASVLQWTFARSGFFMQNLSTTHAAEIRDEGLIMVPAGRGRTSFLDVRDVADVAALALSQDGHAGRAYTPTGSVALTYISSDCGMLAPIHEARCDSASRFVASPPGRGWIEWPAAEAAWAELAAVARQVSIGSRQSQRRTRQAQ
ncbi:hypothetical protein [Planotetraspora sp. GP83]|uniref:hypothetical protein n=1 Tax=Planotetraspora sp. GP83 TaxID=3156264 RepID=UPI003515B3AF